MREVIKVKRHEDLSSADLAALQQLFDNEYKSEHGPWNPDAPYGYSPADLHVLAFQGTVLAAHVGFQRRVIGVGGQDITVAGTGGVLVDEQSRGTGLGGRAMHHAQQVMRDEARVCFGFLGCRQEVVPFYASVGWVRIHATERCLSRLHQATVVVSEEGPHLVCTAMRDAYEWPHGDIDLRGTPW
jgi:aminoglycoside 2'-N-acetyltransferase I